jgi:hypothetical protein
VLVGRELGDASQQHDGRARGAAQSQVHGEVGVGGNDDQAVCFGASGDLDVAGGREAHIDDVIGVVSVVAQRLGDPRG